MLWQFTNGSFLHSTSWNPFTHPGQMYPWVIIKPIYGQKCISFQQWKDTLCQHLSIHGVGDCINGTGTRELVTIPRSNCLPGNMTGQELKWHSIMKIGVRHSRSIGKLVGCWWKWESELMGTPHPQNPNNCSMPTNQRLPHSSHDLQTSAESHFGALGLQPQTIWSSSFSIVFVNNSLTAHLGSVLTGYPSYDYS